MKKWIVLFLLFPLISFAQTYKYIGVEDGLSNRRVYYIQKGPKGYMWFLTHEGIDRYNGKNFKHYKLKDGEEEITSLAHSNWLYIDTKGELWEIGKMGRIFNYDAAHDCFAMVYKFPHKEMLENGSAIDYSFVDRNNHIWLCSKKGVFLYNTESRKRIKLTETIKEDITTIKQIDETHFFIGTDAGIHYAELKKEWLRLIPCGRLQELNMQINELHYDAERRKLFIGTFQRGIFIYDMNTGQIHQPAANLVDMSISRISWFKNKELLVATDGAGVYKLNVETYQLKPYIAADYDLYNGMNGSSINDMYVDGDQRIWLANYPIGVTIRNNRYASYKWIKHSIGNKESLINDQVNSIIEDHEGDLWYGTNNGVSLYNTRTGKWHSFQSSFDKELADKSHIIITLCEVRPGVIWVGGYNSGIYEIDKKSLSIDYFVPSLFCGEDIYPDKYIRVIKRDSAGDIWSGGYHFLKRRDFEKKSCTIYKGLNSITAIVEKDSRQMWVGSVNGLFLLDKKSGNYRQIKLPVESTYIYSLYQDRDGLLYIGTSGSGLIVFDKKKKRFFHYHTKNSALISNNIYALLSDGERNILLSTENGLVYFHSKERVFHNWTKDQGLMSTRFNAGSGTLCRNGWFVMGSSDGAVEFDRKMNISRKCISKMIFSDFRLFYQTVYLGDKGSPLTENIDDTKVLKLNSNQNIFSLNVSSVNYDYPSNNLYSWKLEGFYDEWCNPTSENVIRYTNLTPGTYTLRVRAISNEDNRVVTDERSMLIIVDYPFWLSFWAMLLYAAVVAMIAFAVIRVVLLRKQRRISEEKINFFVNTAHDIRTPLTLIKAPLDELSENKSISLPALNKIKTALRNVNSLLNLTSNLINFERADIYSTELLISEYELNAFIATIYHAFLPYAEMKSIDFTYKSEVGFQNAWFDKNKMDSILRNLISNALKYTPEHGQVHIALEVEGKIWNIEIRDTGIGIPLSEQKKLFKIHFRGSNAINSTITGSGIGLMLVHKLVALHKGTITMESVENEGSVVRISFPLDSKLFHKVHFAPVKEELLGYEMADKIVPGVCDKGEDEAGHSAQRILIVEDNSELCDYMRSTLSDRYIVETCGDGKQALGRIEAFNPELIISDIMMPVMRGDDLCRSIKNNIETSHIPVILLTALSEEKDILKGLHIGADEYMVKPFNIGILKATIATLLLNRAILRNKYAHPDKLANEYPCANCSSDLDWTFIATIQKHVIDNIDNPALTVDTLASLVGMSRTSLYNKVKALTGESPGDYIRVVRLTYASNLLKKGVNNVTEVAELCGFNDVKYFREVFKKYFKVSPSKYSKGERE